MRYLAVVLCAAAATVCAHAQDAGILKLPQDIEFKGPLSGAPFGRGETWDESKFTAYPAGTFYSEPQKAPHFTGQRTATLSYKLPVLARRVRHLSSRRTDSAADLISGLLFITLPRKANARF